MTIDLDIARKIYELIRDISGYSSFREYQKELSESENRRIKAGARKLLKHLNLNPGDEKEFFHSSGIVTDDSLRKIIEASDWIDKDGEHCIEVIRLFERSTPLKAVWLVITSKRLICACQTNDWPQSILRWRESLEDLRKERTNVAVDKHVKVVEIRGPEARHRWYYSRKLHGNGKTLEDVIWSSIDGAVEATSAGGSSIGQKRSKPKTK